MIFVLSLNQGDSHSEPCRALLDVDSPSLTWSIIISAITRAEATLHEYLDQLEQRCALQGLEWIEVPQTAIAATMKQQRQLKAKLDQAGMQSHDIKQVFAAVAGQAALFVTRDRDFFDPKDKAQRAKKSRGTAVSRLLQTELGLTALFPAEAHARLLALSPDDAS
ncbi:hypothetical protein [Nannocystis sp.]|uniref:hypothetical protein n=1 Tax=Nannocystis sp. TaxID=1962667 RepID=UPI0025E503FA|nr:hypothetical protein [Nannocystis sp.]MBK7823673.1 hypothetical protein [Nannocystis sp.]